MRIEQSENDQVIVAVGCAEEGTRVIDHGVNPGVAIGMLGVTLPPQHQNGGINLDGIDTFRSTPQGSGDVIPGSRSNYYDVLGLVHDLVGKVVIISCLTDGSA